MAKTRQNAIAVISTKDATWKVPFKKDDFASRAVHSKLSNTVVECVLESKLQLICDAILVEIDLEETTASLVKTAIQTVIDGFHELVLGKDAFEFRQGKALIIRLEPYRKASQEETKISGNEQTKQTICLPKLFNDGTLDFVNEWNSPLATELVKLLQKTTPKKQQLQKIESAANAFVSKNRTFEWDENGYEQSSQVVNILHDVAFQTRSSICLKGIPVFLRRLLPPARNEKGKIEFAIHRAIDESLIDKRSQIPTIQLVPISEIENIDCGHFQLFRQKMIEQFRRKILKLAGLAAETIDDAKEIKKLVNDRRHQLGVGLGVVVDNQLVQVSLEVSHKSFQLKQGRRGYIKEFSGQEFPCLMLVDSHFEDDLTHTQ